jgi:hypothetical protein
METPKQTKTQLALVKKVIAQLNNYCCIGSVPDTTDAGLTQITTAGDTLNIFIL